MKITMSCPKVTYSMDAAVYEHVVKHLHQLGVVCFPLEINAPIHLTYNEMAGAYQRIVQCVTEIITRDMNGVSRNYKINLDTSMFMAVFCNALMNVEGLKIEPTDNELYIDSPSFMPPGEYVFGDIIHFFSRSDLVDLADGVHTLPSGEIVALFTVNETGWKTWYDSDSVDGSFYTVDFEYGQSFRSFTGRIGVMLLDGLHRETHNIEKLRCDVIGAELPYHIVQYDRAFKCGYTNRNDHRIICLSRDYTAESVIYVDIDEADDYDD